MSKHALYILSGRLPGPVFIGTASDLPRRLRQHSSGKVSHPRFRIDRLVYTETYDCAFKAESPRPRLAHSLAAMAGRPHHRSNNPAWQELRKRAYRGGPSGLVKAAKINPGGHYASLSCLYPISYFYNGLRAQTGDDP